jgi:hypothetical protein
MPVNSSKINLGLPQLPEGVPEQLFQHFYQVYTAFQNLTRYLSQYAGVDEWDSSLWSQLGIDETIFPGTLGRWYVKQNEALTYGQAVSPIVSGAELQVRLANATNNTRWCCGIVSSQDHVSAIGEYCEVSVGVARLEGLAGMTAGQRYWLSTVNGTLANAPAVAAGNIEQLIGWALSPTRLLMNVSGYFVQH